VKKWLFDEQFCEHWKKDYLRNLTDLEMLWYFSFGLEDVNHSEKYSLSPY
jgi:hypothetical protein